LTVDLSALGYIDVMQPCDFSYLLDSWLKGFKNSPRGVRTENYWTSQRAVCEKLLGSAETLIFRPKGWPEGIMGWLCGERQGSAHVVHFCVTKKAMRSAGICTALLKEQAGDATSFVYTHLRPPYSLTLEHRGYSYDRGRIHK
jgi:hypothetical protein